MRLVFVLALLALGACSSHPSDEELREQFLADRAAFDELADMAEDDANYSRISYDFVHPRWDLPEDARPGDPPAARWDRYRQVFRNLDLESGVTNYQNDVVVLEKSSSGLVTSGSSVGFMRAAKLPTSIKLIDDDANLDCTLDNEGWCSAAKRLSDDWYIIIERH